MNERYGDGTADMKNSHASMLPGDSFSSVKKAIANSQAYDRGLDMATVSDPMNGKADFDTEFSRSEENGHKDFGVVLSMQLTPLDNRSWIRALKAIQMVGSLKPMLAITPRTFAMS